MVKKVEKSIPWLIILAIFSLVGLISFSFLMDPSSKINAASDFTASVTVTNATPTIGAITLNGGSDVTLIEYSTTTIEATFTITDGNGWDDIATPSAFFYNTNTSTCNLSLIQAEGGNDAAQWCYEAYCNLMTTTSNSYNASCTVDVWFIANPTDASSSYSANAWNILVSASDTAGLIDTNSTTQEVNSLAAAYMPATLSYGSVDPGATSSNDIHSTTTNTGNSMIDLDLSGDDMSDGSGHTIAAGQQKYSTSTVIGDWTNDAWAIALTNAEASTSLQLAHPSATATGPNYSNSATEIWWVISIPDPQYAAAYTGTNTYQAYWRGQ